MFEVQRNFHRYLTMFMIVTSKKKNKGFLYLKNRRRTERSLQHNRRQLQLACKWRHVYIFKVDCDWLKWRSPSCYFVHWMIYFSLFPSYSLFLHLFFLFSPLLPIFHITVIFILLFCHSSFFVRPWLKILSFFFLKKMKRFFLNFPVFYSFTLSHMCPF